MEKIRQVQGGTGGLGWCGSYTLLKVFKRSSGVYTGWFLELDGAGGWVVDYDCCAHLADIAKFRGSSGPEYPSVQTVLKSCMTQNRAMFRDHNMGWCGMVATVDSP